MPMLSPLALALLGQLPAGNDGPDPEPDQDADDTTQQVSADEQFRRSLADALLPRKQPTFGDILSGQIAGQSAIKPKAATDKVARVPLDAQPTLPASMSVPFQRVTPGTTEPIGPRNELEQYIRTSPETQKWFGLVKHRSSSPEDAAAYAAARREGAPHEAEEELTKWKEADSLAKKMQGKQLAMNERQADTKDAARMRSYAPSMNSAMAESRAEMAALPNDPVARRAQMELDLGRDQMRRNQAPTNPLLWAALAGTGRGQLIADAGSQRMAIGNKNQEAKDAAEFEERKARMSDRPRVTSNWTTEQRESNAEAVKTAKLRGERSSARNLAAMIAGRGGQTLSAKDMQDPRVLKAYAAGQRQGPTLAQAMAFQRDRDEERRAAGRREDILKQVAAYQRMLADELAGAKVPEKIAEYNQTIARLMSLMEAAPTNVAVLPEMPGPYQPPPPKEPAAPRPPIGIAPPSSPWAGRFGGY